MHLSLQKSYPGKVLLFLLVIAGGLIISGVCLNILVMVANGGKMPVATKAEDVLFVIGKPKLGVEYFHTDESFSGDMTHKKMTSETRLAILADRIPLSLTWIKPEDTYPLFWAGMEIAQLPIGIGGAIMSIGDLTLWLGLAITIPLSILLTPICLFLFLKHLLKRLFM